MVSRLPPKNRYGRAARISWPFARVGDHHVLLEHARADAQERHAIAMALVHVRLDLEHEPAEVAAPRAGSRRGRSRGRFGGGASSVKRVQKRLEAEVRQRAAEEHRRVAEVEIRLVIERRARAGDERGFVDQVLPRVLADQLRELRIVRRRRRSPAPGARAPCDRRDGRCRCCRSKTPRKRSPLPIGQFIGTA